MAEQLGGTLKVKARYGIYKDRDDRPVQQKIALEHPEKIFNIYVELADGQFIEFFPMDESEDETDEGSRYSHFALLTDDLEKTVEELKAKGVPFDSEISKGPSGTWQIWSHDPDGNRFEIMQFTDDSWQVNGYGLDDRA